MTPAQRLTDAFDRVCGLSKLRQHEVSDAEAEAFEPLRGAIVNARQDEGLLAGHCEDTREAVLQFLARRGEQKKIIRPRVNECLKILLNLPDWMATASSIPDLRDRLDRLLGGLPELATAMSEPPPEVSPEPARREDSRRERLGSQASPWSVKVAPDTTDIRGKLLEGFRIMKEFEWQVPRDPTSAALDTATQAFRMVHDAVQKLSKTYEYDREHTNLNPEDEFIEDTLNAKFSEEWGGVITFLVSMFNTRAAYKGRIKYVADKLQLMSPSFGSELASRGTQPWETFEAITRKRTMERGISGQTHRESEISEEPEATLADVSPTGSSSEYFDAEEPKRGIVWVDKDRNAFENSSLQSEHSVCFRGFQDDGPLHGDQTPAWMNYISERMGTPAEVSVIILNGRHQGFIRDHSKKCEEKDCEVPAYIICGYFVPKDFENLTVKGKNVVVDGTKDRTEAAKKALTAFHQSRPSARPRRSTTNGCPSQ